MRSVGTNYYAKSDYTGNTWHSILIFYTRNVIVKYPHSPITYDFWQIYASYAGLG